MKKTVTVMCDYCADGLWINGVATTIDYFKNPKLLRLKKRIEGWQREYENMFWDFDSANTSKVNLRIFNKKKKFRDFVKEGKKIAVEVRKNLSPVFYKVEYFNEESLKRELIYNGKSLGSIYKLCRIKC